MSKEPSPRHVPAARIAVDIFAVIGSAAISGAVEGGVCGFVGGPLGSAVGTVAGAAVGVTVTLVTECVTINGKSAKDWAKDSLKEICPW